MYCPYRAALKDNEFFGLKGHNIEAQGEALRRGYNKDKALKVRYIFLVAVSEMY
jgi:hypothetical protein